MKRTTTKNFLLSVCFFICGMLGTVYGQKVTKHTITMGAQNQKAAYGGFVDLITANVYSLSNVGGHQASIDLIYVYGKSTKYGLMMPSSSGLRYFGKNYRDKVYAAWKQKNRGILVALENNKANRKLYKSIKTNQQLEDAYTHAVTTVSQRPGYKKGDHGPTARLNRLNIGDYVLVKSRDRGIYAIGRIVNGEAGYQGNITIDFKITTKE